METISRISLLVALTILLSSMPAGAVQAPSATSASPPTEEMSFPERGVIKQAVDLLSDGKNADAKQLLLDAIHNKNATADADVYYLLALTEYNDGDYKSAVKDLQHVLEMPSPNKDPRRRVLLLKRIGDCYMALRHDSDALTNYQSALAAAKDFAPTDSLRIKLNEDIMQCYIVDKDYDKALPYGQHLLETAKARASSGDMSDPGGLLWAYFENLDLLRRLGTKYDADRLRLRNEAGTLVQQFVQARSDLQSAGQLPTLDEIRTAFLSSYVKENHPATMAEYLWLTSDFKVRTSPIVGWYPPDTPKAILLCIHGLGLENRAFTRFGQAMAKRGFAVLAMDVRGFGSWLETPGQEDVQFEYSLQDIGGITSFEKERNPQMPIFLVGESMGGGIALQAAARYPKTFAGVISSVPSPDRFQEGRASISVATHFLKGRNKRFDLGTMVAQKATSSPTLLHTWEIDPKAKLEMTPRELMRFDKFMKQTEKQCATITGTPVFIVQGGRDRLVKPQGSQDLYNAVAADDKSLLIVGDAEHLIFETEHPSPILLDALASWMSNHMTAAP